MADVHRLSLDWNEIDRSVISAISSMKIARDRFVSHSVAKDSGGSQSANLPATGVSGRQGWGQTIVRDEQIAICFDDAERMLDEVRARIMMARALLSGAPQFVVPARAKFAVAAAFSEGELNRPLRKTLFSRGARMAFRIVVRAKSTASRSMYSAFLLRAQLTRHGISLFRNAKAFSFSCSNQLRRALRPRSTTSGRRQYFEAAAVVLGAAAFSLLASSALAVWMASDVASKFSATAPPLPAAHNVPAASAAYTGCPVAGWGKTCYPRRAQP